MDHHVMLEVQPRVAETPLKPKKNLRRRDSNNKLD